MGKRRSRQTGEKRELAGGKEERFKKDNYFREEEKKPDIPKKRRGGKKAGDSGKGKYRMDKSLSGNGERLSSERRFTEKEDFLTDRQEPGGNDSFQEGGDDAFVGSRKLERKRQKAEKAGRKLQKAKDRAPKTRDYHWERVFDEETGKGKFVLKAVEREKELPGKSFAGGIARGFRYGSRKFYHNREKEYGEDNAGAEAFFMAGRQASHVLEFWDRKQKDRERRLGEKVSALEEKAVKAEVGARYQEYLEKNPEMEKKLIRKRIQKKRIKREYMKEYRKKLAEESAEKTVAFTKNTAIGVFKKLEEAVKRKAAIIGVAGLFILLFLFLLTMFSSCGAVAGEMFSIVIAGSYLSEPEEIDKAELSFTEKEMELQEKIDNIEEDYPDYDEYQYNLAEIGHNPFTLISYLSAIYIEFTAYEAENELESLFQEMYLLELNPVTETRTVQAEDGDGNPVFDGEGNPVMENVEVRILQVSLLVTPLEEIAAGRMDGEQAEIFAAYTETKGGLQQFDTPLDLYWYSYVSSYYGYRKNPVTGERQLHRGIDIAVPESTCVYAAHSGVVEAAGYDGEYGNYVVIGDDKGFTTKYAHLSAVSVSAGQDVESGVQIGLTGSTGSSTGSHLHLEVVHNGTYYNPIFYFDTGDGTLYGETPGGGNGTGNIVPPGSYDEEAVQRLMTEAEKYLGTPYLFGGYGPGGFDCSGFVSWVFTHSGVHELPRTTAQGIYEKCIPVSAGEARAGDIVFFTGTYQAGRPVTHVGIYCGNGIMIHAGDPVQYTSIGTSSYWQSHFYGFGRF